MPSFDFTSPEGKTYTIDGPEGATKEQAFQILQQHLSGSENGGSSVSGIGKSLGTGLAQGVLGLAGLPADLAHLYAPNQSDANPLGSAGLQKKVERYTGDFYKPQGALEETAAKLGQFAPAAIGGPETLAARLATRVAAPAVGSEIGSQVGGPIGGVAGALAGGFGASALSNRVAAIRNATPTLTGEDLINAGRKGFQAGRDMDMQVTPQWTKDTTSEMRTALDDFKDSSKATDVFAKIKRIDDLNSAPVGQLYNAKIPSNPVSMNKIEEVRKQLSEMRLDPDPTTRAAAKIALNKLVERQQGLTQADVIAGDANSYARTMQEAVANYGAGKRAQVIEGKQMRGENASATKGVGAEDTNSYRQALKPLVQPLPNTNVRAGTKLGFNDQELNAVERAMKGGAVGNTARYLGKFAPTGVVSLAGTEAIAHTLGVPGVIPAAGYIAKKIGDLSTKRAIAALNSLVISRSPLAKQVASQLPPSIVNQISPRARLLLTTSVQTPALVQGQGEPVPAPINQLGQTVGR